MRFSLAAGLIALSLAAASVQAGAQDSGSLFSPGSAQETQQPNLLTQPTLSPGVAFLYSLEAKFAAAVATGGGKAFATWFAPDGIAMANGKDPVIGRAAIAAQSLWAPKDYQLTWTPVGGQLSPQGDMGFTYGHYEGRSKDAEGNPVVVTGRYLTVWKKQANGEWKVAMDASQEEPPDNCCALKGP
jgi:ketosteroid isomerase-like protein